MKLVRQILIALLAAAVVTAIVGLGALQRMDKWMQDSLYQRPGVTSGDILIIGIDDDAIDLLGPYHTWDRNVVASALEALAVDPEKKPAVTAVDVLYAGQTSPEADERLAKAAGNLGHVVTAAVATFGEKITWENGRAVSLDTSAVLAFDQAYDALRGAATTGHINAMVDMDGVLRHALLYVEPEEGNRVYSMACETARAYMAAKGLPFSLPKVNGMGHYYVPFTGRPGSYYDGVSIAYLISGKVPPDYWAGKVVLIGPYATALQDQYFTSIDRAEQMYGVEFQANVIQSLIERNFKAEVPDTVQLAVLFVVLAALMVLLLRIRLLPGALIALGLIGAAAGGSLLLYNAGLVTHPLWLPVGLTVIYLLAAAFHYWKTARERQRLALEKERLDAELSLATRIQASALPKDFPAFPDRSEFDIYASMHPAKEVGGDFYDFFLIDEDHLGLAIGDVSGKGVPAALFMMVSSSLIHHMASREKSPAKVLEIVNGQICSRNPEEMFVTVWLGVLEISTGVLKAANAGHEYPALRRADGSFELVKDRHGFVVGGMDGTRYREYSLELAPGDRLFVYTDGVTEATDAQKQLFGNDRLVEALRRDENGTPAQIIDAVTRAAAEFVGKAPQFDDMTMLCLEYKGPGLSSAPDGDGQPSAGPVSVTLQKTDG